MLKSHALSGRKGPAKDPSPRYTRVSVTEDLALRKAHVRHSKRYRKSQDWTPWPLGTTVFIVFALVFLLMLASLITIYYFARHQDGLEMLTSNHYAWTYGPTAVFVVIISFWRLVDYHCKALAPWQELKMGSALPERSVWLDHISELLVITFSRAASYSHFSVMLTIFGFLMLKLATLASTGLFLPAIKQVGPLTVPMKQMTRFGNASALVNQPETSPLYTLYAIMERGFPAPDGVEDYLLYETLRPAINKIYTNMTYQTRTRAFVPVVTCDYIEVEVLFNASEYGTETGAAARQGWGLDILDSSNWTCSQQDLGLNLIMTMSASSQVCPPRQLYPVFTTLSCSRTNDINAANETLILMGVADLQYSQTFNISLEDYSIGDYLIAETWSFDIPTITASLCQVSHSLENVDIVYNVSATLDPHGTVEQIADTPKSAIVNLTSSTLTAAVASAAAAGNALFGSSVHLQDAEQPPVAIMKLIASRAGGDYEALLNDPIETSKAAEDVLSSLLVQIAYQVMTYETEEPVAVNNAIGQMFYTQSRLQVQSTSLFLIAAGVFVMLPVTAMLYYLRPMTSSRENIESIHTLAAVLRESVTLHDHILALSASSEKDAKACMVHNTYSSCKTATGATKVTINASRDSVAAHQVPNAPSVTYKMKAHAPLTLAIPFMILTLVSAPIMIGILEYLQRRSDASVDGLKPFSDTANIEVSALTRYIPGLIALLIATLYNILDFNTLIVACYSKMQNRFGSPQDLSIALLAQLPPVALYKAARHGYWAACLTGSAALVGSALTIIASGLYVVEYAPISTEVEIALSETWNTSFHEGLASDNATSAVVSLMETVNLTYPLFTYDELVFPALSILAGQDSPASSGSGLVTARVPALRAELVCTKLSDGLVHNSTGTSRTSTGPLYIMKRFNATVPLPDNCVLGSQYGNESFIHVASMSSRLETPINITYNAKYVDLHVGPWNGGFQDTGTLYPSQPDNPPGCPSVLIAHAYFNGNDSSRSTLTVLSCEQKIQRIDTNLTLRTTDISIPATHPPIPDETSAVYINSGPNNETAFWWRLQPGIDDALKLFNNSAIDPYLLEHDSISSIYDVSNFFRGALFGRTPLPLSSLESQDEAGRERLFEHVQKFYRRYMAQYISANMRIPIDGEPQILPAIHVSDVGLPCLKQNETTKIVLQSMLAFMFTCGTLAWCFNKYHDLVPWNPCTIMGVMVLFAGSKFCQPAQNDRSHISGSDDQILISSRSRLEDDTEHCEMAQFASPRQEINSYNAHAGVVTDSSQALTEDGTDSSVGVTSSSRHRVISKARFQLGWWKDGVFTGSRRAPQLSDDPVRGRWRYGIDVVE